MTRELLQRALDALEQYKKYTRGVMIPSTHCTGNAAITALREALAAPMPEPVAWLWLDQDGYTTMQTVKPYHDAEPLYAAPPAAPAVPLTDERAAFEAWIRKDSGDLTTFGSGSNMHYRNSAVNNAWAGWQARAAHGIGGGHALLRGEQAGQRG